MVRRAAAAGTIRVDADIAGMLDLAAATSTMRTTAPNAAYPRSAHKHDIIAPSP
jgi:hypothetical protein